MIAVILNSGLGSRLGALTKGRPKGLTELAGGETLFARQLKILAEYGVERFVVTTGPNADLLEEEGRKAAPSAEFTFVSNPDYASTNYIYSLALAHDAVAGEDVLFLHGDLVFDPAVVGLLLEANRSVVTVDSTIPIPDKDFKASLSKGIVAEIGVDLVGPNLISLQPFYKLKAQDWDRWLAGIQDFCRRGLVNVYAEEAFNVDSDSIGVAPLDLCGTFCQEIDTPEDLLLTNERLSRDRL